METFIHVYMYTHKRVYLSTPVMLSSANLNLETKANLPEMLPAQRNRSRADVFPDVVNQEEFLVAQGFTCS